MRCEWLGPEREGGTQFRTEAGQTAPEDVLEYLTVGATAVQVGEASFTDQLATGSIADVL